MAGRIPRQRRVVGRFPAQLVAMVDEGTDGEIRSLADAQGVSIAHVLRQVVAAGLPIVRKNLNRRGVAA